MAKNNSFVADKATGSAGNITFANWKGIDYFKQKATVVANPRTPKQIAQRSKITQLVVFFQLYANLLKVGFKEKAVKMSEYNAFVKENISDAFNVTTPLFPTLDINKVFIAKGSLSVTELLTIICDISDQSCTVTWNPTLVGSSQANSDEFNVYIVNSLAPNSPKIHLGVAKRSDGTATFLAPDGMVTTGVVKLQYFFTSVVSRKGSNGYSVDTFPVA